MAPNVIIMARHGEKPADHGTPFGVDHHGRTDEHSLSVAGWMRAGALAALFGQLPSAGHPGLVRPGRVYATGPTADAKSMRETHTAQPTADRLHLALDASFQHGHEARLAAAVCAQDEDALIVWHHGGLADLVRHFDLVNDGDVPDAWPEDRYDLFWILTREPGDSETFRFAALPQRLFGGDADEV